MPIFRDSKPYGTGRGHFGHKPGNVISKRESGAHWLGNSGRLIGDTHVGKRTHQPEGHDVSTHRHKYGIERRGSGKKHKS